MQEDPHPAPNEIEPMPSLSRVYFFTLAYQASVCFTKADLTHDSKLVEDWPKN